MASVSSLDQDVRKLRLDRYTPAAAKEVRAWIEGVLGEKLAPGDLMEALKDGVALCRMVNMATSPGVKYKQSNMPFVQMENISHFLRACELPPLSLPAHDRFLTVDLYDGKDPAQVLQCLAAFSRAAHAANPSSFPAPLGGKSKVMSPQGTGSSAGARSPGYTTNSPLRPRGLTSPSEPPPSYTFNPLNKAAYSTGSGRTSPVKSTTLNKGGLASGGPVSSWTSKGDENKTAPAWNIHQYGYMGGASQGNLGVAFGARRQITSAAPDVPSLAEKEKRLREKLEQEQREAEERQRLAQAEREAEAERLRQEEEQARLEEERRWAEETRKLRKREEAERQRQEAQRQRRLQEQEEEEAEREQQRIRRQREAAETREREAQMAKDRLRKQHTGDRRLNGQFLSQYQSDQTRAAAISPPSQSLSDQASAERQRIADLERQLEDLRAQQRQAEASPPILPRKHDPQTPALPARNVQTSAEDDWAESEREYLKTEWSNAQSAASDGYAPPKPARPLPNQPSSISSGSRPLPDPSAYQAGTNRTGRYLATTPAPQQAQPRTVRTQDYSTTSEVDLENQRRQQSQAKTKAGGWASKSLLEREMERERERQREWESSQQETSTRSRNLHEGSQPGQSWDVHQYGYMGGDSQNRAGPGLGVGGARRQIIGPRPPP